MRQSGRDRGRAGGEVALAGLVRYFRAEVSRVSSRCGPRPQVVDARQSATVYVEYDQ